MLSVKIPWLRNEVHWIAFKTILRGTFVCVRPVLLVIFAVVASVKRDQFAATGVPGCTNETNHRPCYDGTIFKTSALVSPSLVSCDSFLEEISNGALILFRRTRLLFCLHALPPKLLSILDHFYSTAFSF